MLDRLMMLRPLFWLRSYITVVLLELAYVGAPLLNVVFYLVFANLSDHLKVDVSIFSRSLSLATHPNFCKTTSTSLLISTRLLAYFSLNLTQNVFSIRSDLTRIYNTDEVFYQVRLPGKHIVFETLRHRRQFDKWLRFGRC